MRPLEGVKVVEVAMWAFVPAAGGMLADMGASVLKIEPPEGDPIRGLTIGGVAPGEQGFILSWENYNRGKRSMTLDLRQPAGVEVLYKLICDADVFLTNLLPRARRRMKIDIDDLRARNPRLIYAVGSGSGRRGPEADKGGFDSITYWHRGGISSSLTPPTEDYPIGMPCGAFGDCTSAAMLAGAVAAAIAQRAMTGHASVVDASLLNTAMWSMQRAVTQATLSGVDRLPTGGRAAMPNPLVNNYRTADGRVVALCMLQSQRYWPGLCGVIGRPELAADPRFATEEDRTRNMEACLAELDAVFATKPLAHWREALSRQEGQWDVVQHVGELKDDPQVNANDYLQLVDYGDGRALKMVSTPMQFDGAALPVRPAPGCGAHSDEVLGELGYDEAAIIDLKVANVVQ
ncbi:MAG TPA: CoA transferase [Phenylobacterium sp.]|uniref:CaiB/BaiF CoA transferase family protein n=1 Tax=Phenylobacterium sp. TaxID=1871053 RepID=UPI002B4985DA|nr:CoA transferase [Phenylobacterium sp.]HKR87911.1 CoA transferase [Phenylobacterium sp.]